MTGRRFEAGGLRGSQASRQGRAGKASTACHAGSRVCYKLCNPRAAGSEQHQQTTATEPVVTDLTRPAIPASRWSMLRDHVTAT